MWWVIILIANLWTEPASVRAPIQACLHLHSLAIQNEKRKTYCRTEQNTVHDYDYNYNIASQTEHQVNKLQSIQWRMALLDVNNQTIIEIPIINTDFVITSQFVTNKLTAAAAADKRSLNGNVYICAAVKKVLNGTIDRSIGLDCLCQPCWHGTNVHRTISYPLILADCSKRTNSNSSAIIWAQVSLFIV